MVQKKMKMEQMIQRLGYLDWTFVRDQACIALGNKELHRIMQSYSTNNVWISPEGRVVIVRAAMMKKCNVK